MLVVEPAGEAEGLEARIGVSRDVAELVVVNPLNDRASGRVNDQSWAAEVITDDPVRHASLDHIVWDVGFAAVDEARDHVPSTVQFRYRVELVLVQEALQERAIHFFAHPPVLAIHYVLFHRAVRQRYALQIPEHIIIAEGGCLAQLWIGFREQFAIGGVGEGNRLPGYSLGQLFDANLLWPRCEKPLNLVSPH